MVFPNRDVPSICHACQLGKHCHFHFSHSLSCSTILSKLIQSDVWTFPCFSFTVFGYYISYIDDYSSFLRRYPIKNKFEVYEKFCTIFVFVKLNFLFQLDHFNVMVHLICETSAISFFFLDSHGSQLRISCPNTHQGIAKRTHRTILKMVRSLLFQAQLPANFWIETLHTTIHLC